MKKIVATSLMLATLSVAVQNALADTNSTDPNTTSSTATAVKAPQVQAKKAWLGVVLAPVPDVVATQLSDIVPENQGVMVQAVSPNSPAAKAGLQAYDIILGFNNGKDTQQIYSAKQLAGLIASSKPKDEIGLNLVRKGKKQDIKVSLGGINVNNPMHPPRAPMFGGINNGAFGSHPFMRPNNPGFRAPLFPQPMRPQQPVMPKALGKANVMQQFESISINKTGDGKVHAEVTIDDNGNKKEFTFDGKYDEVRKQIQETKELPEDKKNSLLNALQDNPNQLIPNGFMNFPQMPGFPAMPSFGNFYNQQPQAPSWFRNSPRL